MTELDRGLARRSDVKVTTISKIITDAEIKAAALSGNGIVLVPATETPKYASMPTRLPFPIHWMLSVHLFANYNVEDNHILAMGFGENPGSYDYLLYQTAMGPSKALSTPNAKPRTLIWDEGHADATLNGALEPMWDNALQLFVTAGLFPDGDPRNVLRYSLTYGYKDT